MWKGVVTNKEGFDWLDLKQIITIFTDFALTLYFSNVVCSGENNFRINLHVAVHLLPEPGTFKVHTINFPKRRPRVQGIFSALIFYSCITLFFFYCISLMPVFSIFTLPFRQQDYDVSI